MDENYIWSLLLEEHDYKTIIVDLEGLNRKPESGLELHHIEPERVKTIWLTPLEHLAIHIAHAKVEKTGSFYAKVSSFVRAFPGSYRRILSVSPELKKALISFGQKRPEQTAKMLNHPNTIAARKVTSEKQRETARKNGREGAELVRQKLLGRGISWGSKISESIQSRGKCCCLSCGKEMLAWPSNILQHQRSKKCSDLSKKMKPFTGDWQ